jgi:hypothetical protein
MIETILVVVVLMSLGFMLGCWISAAFHRSVMREFLREMGYDTPEKLRELHDQITGRLTADDSAAVAGKPLRGSGDCASDGHVCAGQAARAERRRTGCGEGT